MLLGSTITGRAHQRGERRWPTHPWWCKYIDMLLTAYPPPPPPPLLAGMGRGLGNMPSCSVIGSLGIRSCSAMSSLPVFSLPTSHTLASATTTSAATMTFSGGTLPAIISSLAGGSSSSKATDPIVVAPGVPALKRSLVEQIQEGKFVDLGELPPAKGFGKMPASLSGDMDGQIVLLQAADYLKSKKHIPDLSTWAQCFAIYASVLLAKHPQRAQSLFMYSATIARLSKKFRWPSWIIYDQHFRQEAADTGKTDWAKIDSGIYTQCFTGMSLTEGWCSICTSMDHVKATCPYKPTEEQPGHRKPPLKPKLPQKRLRTYTKSEEPCRKWNRFNYMDCPHGDTCIFTHQCSICRATDHGALKCERSKAPPRPPR